MIWAVEQSARVILALLFAAAAVHKLRFPREVAGTMAAALRPLRIPRAARRPLVFALAAAEAAASALLAAGGGALAPGFAAAAALLALYTAALLRLRRSGSTAACNCFHSGAEPVGGVHLARNGAFLAVAAAGLLPTLAGPATAPPPSPIAAWALVVPASCAFLLSSVFLPEVVAALRGEAGRA